MDPGRVIEMFRTKPSCAMYKGDYDENELFLRVAVLSNEIKKNVPPKEGVTLEIVLFSVLHVLTEKLSSEQFTGTMKIAVFDRKLAEFAYDTLVNSLRADPQLALELHRAWVKRFSDFLHEEARRDPQLPTDCFLFHAAEEFRINTLLVLRMLKSIMPP